ncbi:MAG: alpha/beta hydrolase [Alphaproteobacteria bacterium]
MKTTFGLLATISILLLSVTGSMAETFIKLKPRPGVSLGFLYSEVEKPVASVILLAGGIGKLKLDRDGNFKKPNNNFLVRTRDLFANNGFNVATVDAPSDRKSKAGLVDFRLTEEHATDLNAVVDFMRRKAPVPVWFVGTSRGTLSAVNAGIRLGLKAPDGLMLTASVTRPSNKGRQSLLDADLGRIQSPVVLFHNIDDSCYLTPFEDLPSIKQRMTNAADVEIISMRGGTDGKNACGGRSYHGFQGIQEQAVSMISDAIKKRVR